MQFCWVFQSPCFISKITFCNTDQSFDSKIAQLMLIINTMSKLHCMKCYFRNRQYYHSPFYLND